MNENSTAVEIQEQQPLENTTALATGLSEENQSGDDLVNDPKVQQYLETQKKEMDRERDRQVTKARETIISNEREKMSIEFEERITQRLEEERKLAKMDKEQLLKYEREQANEKAKSLESKLQMYEREKQATQLLIEEKSDPRLAEFIVDADGEQMIKKFEAITSIIKEATDKVNNDWLSKGGTPKSGSQQPVSLKGLPIREQLKQTII